MIELLVVMPHNVTEAQLAKLSLDVGHPIDNHYPYGETRDVVFQVPFDQVERIGQKLDGLKIVQSYTFNGDEAGEEE